MSDHTLYQKPEGSGQQETSEIKEQLQNIIRKNRPLYPKAHQLPSSLVLSLTSYPPRFATLPLTLECLLSQTVQPDHFILWIAESDREQLTDEILSFTEQGLEIRYCEDIKAYKKLIPSLRQFPESFIVTADDDVYYWPTWLEELVTSWSGEDKEIVAHSAYTVELDNGGQPRPCPEWSWGIKGDIEQAKQSGLNFATGGGGILYPPGSLPEEVLDSETFQELAPHNDDIWLYWMSRRHGSKVKAIRPECKMPTWFGSQQTALRNYNIKQNGDDEQVANMLNSYGFPENE